MRLTMAERRVLIKSFAPRYRKKRKKVKREVLTEFTQMTGYNRCYGAYLLRHQGRRIRLSPTAGGGGRHPEESGWAAGPQIRPAGRVLGNGRTSKTHFSSSWPTSFEV